MIKLHPSWLEVLQQQFEAPYFAQLKEFLVAERQQYVCYPNGRDIFAAFDHTPFDKVKVVILGQDPYHDIGQAHGLCFSVQEGVAHPPSLRNIFQEIQSETGASIPQNGDLTRWARQGVFLLNTCLSVRAHQAFSHSGHGWETFTDAAIQALNAERQNLVFLLWGAPAGRKAAFIDSSRHLVLQSAHPSPLSAYRGFFGNGHFLHCNEYLTAHGIEPILW